MSSQHEISEYINNLPLHKTLCKGFRPADVYEVICNISSMYNQILAESYEENEELKRQIEVLKGEGSESIEKEKREEETVHLGGEVKLNNMSESDEQIVDGLMTDKEFQKLKRTDLLEILFEQSVENDSLKKELKEKERIIEELNKKIQDRRICLDKAGTIAEASFMLNGVYEAAEKAAEQYLENLQELYKKENEEYLQKEAELEKKCATLLQAAYERCEFMKNNTLKQCEEIEIAMKKQCGELLRTTEEKCRELLLKNESR